jgi:hypothetical protein
MRYAFDTYQKYFKNTKWIIRITHDDILIDQITMMELLNECRINNAGYGISPSIVDGAGVEVIHCENLRFGAEHHRQPTEFISYFVKYYPRNKKVVYEPRYSIKRDYRLTMDYPEDWIVLDTILRKVGPGASLDRVTEFIDQNSYILNVNKQPHISVYTCAYNAEQWIEGTIQSVLNQNHQNFEYIIIDDFSKDDTPLIISKYIYDKRIKFIRLHSNHGLASCSNMALNLARGKRIMRVDADDQLIIGALNRMESACNSTGGGILYPAYYEIKNGENDGIAHPPDTFHHAGCALMDKRLINEIRFTDGIRHWDSLDLYNRIKDKFKIEYLNEPQWFYRKHNGSMSSEGNKKERDTALKEISQ